MLLPEWLFRLLLFFLTHSVYRVRALGTDNLPDRGGALIVCNHLSFVDAFLLVSCVHRPVRLLMNKDFYDIPLVRPLARMIKVIPISGEQRPREMIRSLRTASDALRAGELVCIFAEGEVTRTGQMLPFRRGFELILKGVNVPIVPASLDGVWGSIFSFERGRFLWKLPRRIPYPVTVNFGQHMPATSSAFEVRQVVQELQGGAFKERKRSMKTLDHAFVRSARLHPRRFMMADGQNANVTFFSALRRTIILSRRLRKIGGGKEMVGLMLPPSVSGALANFALTLLGRVPINLTYTASPEVVALCARQCDIDVVITSKMLLERFPKLRVPSRVVYIEDLENAPRISESLAALLAASIMPHCLLKKWLQSRSHSIDDLATVVFSGARREKPTGVMLTHYNIASNIQQCSQVFMRDARGKVLGVLPFSHSLGFMATMWLPAISGLGVVYHHDPLATSGIDELVWKYKITVLITTPTLLQSYMARCTPERFGGLQYVLVGTEKLPESVAFAFEDVFGIRPLEFYMCDECSPVVSVNAHDFRAVGFRQVAARRGKVGHPLPGVSVRVIDVETGRPVSPGVPGILLVNGPNVMKGYLGEPEETANVLHDGWYMTRDVAIVGEDGFITVLTDCPSTRFGEHLARRNIGTVRDRIAQLPKPGEGRVFNGGFDDSGVRRLR
jgi:acyl-[acyl-carrier-protein]-phospholipid O-acyltransferase/long-chain-fatty-acid--[acyl-carrier-protein] ligase